jgi:hypothetical protein
MTVVLLAAYLYNNLLTNLSARASARASPTSTSRPGSRSPSPTSVPHNPSAPRVRTASSTPCRSRSWASCWPPSSAPSSAWPASRPTGWCAAGRRLRREPAQPAAAGGHRLHVHRGHPPPAPHREAREVLGVLVISEPDHRHDGPPGPVILRDVPRGPGRRRGRRRGTVGWRTRWSDRTGQPHHGSCGRPGSCSWSVAVGHLVTGGRS